MEILVDNPGAGPVRTLISIRTKGNLILSMNTTVKAWPVLRILSQMHIITLHTAGDDNSGSIDVINRLYQLWSVAIRKVYQFIPSHLHIFSVSLLHHIFAVFPDQVLSDNQLVWSVIGLLLAEKSLNTRTRYTINILTLL